MRGILCESGMAQVIVPSASSGCPLVLDRYRRFPSFEHLEGTNRAIVIKVGLRARRLSSFGTIAPHGISGVTRTIACAPRQPQEALTLVTRKTDPVSQERSLKRAALMARVQDGDRESCRELLDDVGPMLMNFLRRRIADRDEIDDVYQDTLMAFFQARHTYEPSRPLEPWLFAIARNIAADHARRYWRRAGVEQLSDEMPEASVVDEPRPDPNLEAVMARLPDPQREAFAMLKIEGLSIEQAATRAGISVGALRVRAHRAYKALRKLISE